jgi:hypothetical protein
LLNFISISAIKLAPKKWGMSGTSQLALVAFLGGSSFLVSQGIEIRPNLAAILALASADAIFLGARALLKSLPSGLHTSAAYSSMKLGIFLLVEHTINYVVPLGLSL